MFEIRKISINDLIDELKKYANDKRKSLELFISPSFTKEVLINEMISNGFRLLALHASFKDKIRYSMMFVVGQKLCTISFTDSKESSFYHIQCFPMTETD